MSRDEQLHATLAVGESETVEFLPSAVDLEAVGCSVCALLNGEGGTVLVGVGARGEPRGVERAETVLTELRRDLLAKLSPLAPWSAEISPLDGVELIEVQVPLGLERPYVYSDRIFVRRGSLTRAASGPEITALVQQRLAGGTRWERQPALGFGIEDLDTDEVVRLAAKAQQARGFLFPDPKDPRGILERLNLAAGETVLNGAVVLFGRHPQRRFPQTRVRFARFVGRTFDEMADNRLLEGNLFSLLGQLDTVLRDHVPVRSQLRQETRERRDTPAYPWPALHEALHNAFAHRDYASFSGGLSVAVFDDRLEIWNSAQLPEGIHAQDLKELGRSRPHNPDIALVLFLAGLIEAWGVGTRRIVAECRAAGLPDPEWKEEAGGVAITLRLRSLPTIELNPRQIKLLERLAPGDAIKPGEYAASVSVQERQARMDLVELADAGFLKRQGKGPATAYLRTTEPYP